MLHAINDKPEMNGYLLELHVALEEKLAEITAAHTDDAISLSANAVQIITVTMNQLKVHVHSKTFIDEGEEIYFFKYVKPFFLSKLIYFVHMFRIATEMPKALKTSELKYLRIEQQQLESFYFQHKEFCAYYRSKSSFLDQEYFVRGKIGLHSTRNPFIFSVDPTFSTSHDFLAAEILAADRLGYWLTSLLNDSSGDLDFENSHHFHRKDSTNQPFAQTTFRAAEIYLFLKALIDSQAVVNHTYKSFFELVIPGLATKLNKSLTPASLLKYSDKIDTESRENVKRLLMKMVRNIDNY